MRRVLGCLLILGTLAAVPARADDVPHLDLVRGLRSSGMADLAKEYLEKLKVDPATPADLKAALPLEFARTSLEMADDEMDDNRRSSYLDEASVGFDAFIKANPASPLVPQARFELARLSAKRGNLQLDKARREDDPAKKKAEMAKARPYFVAAASGLKAAAEAIDAQLTKLGDPSSPSEKAAKAELAKSKHQAVLEQGINLYNQAKTTGALTEQGKFVDEARKIFTALGSNPDALRYPYGWLAKAWNYRATAEVDTEANADGIYNALMNEKGTVADAGKRLARYFRIVSYQEKITDTKDVPKLKKVVDAAVEWRASNRTALKTFEGRGVTWLLARDLLAMAETEIRRDPKDPFKVTMGTNAGGWLVQAEPLFRELADSDNEYTDRAERQWLRVMVLRTGGKTEETLKGFAQHYVAAQVSAYRASQALAGLPDRPDEPAEGDAEAVKAQKEKAINEWEEKRQKAIAAGAEDRKKVPTLLKTAIEQFDPKKDSPRERVRAQMMLAAQYRNEKNYPEAIKLYEQVARDNRNTRGLQAANQALQAAVGMLEAAPEEDTATNDKGEEVTIRPKDLVRKKIRDLALFIESTWPKDPLTDTARHFLAQSLQREQLFADACVVYNRITPAYAAYHATRLQAGILAYAVEKSKEKTPDAQKAVQTTLAQLASLAPPEAGNSDAARAYFQAKVQLGYFYLLPSNKKYAEADTLAKQLQEAVAKTEGMDDDDKKAATESVDSLRYWSVYNLGSTAAKAGDMTKATGIVTPLVDGPAPDKSFEKVRTARREVLMLGLRCAVSENNLARAREILAKLQAEQKEGEEAGASQTNTLLAVVTELQGQINDARKQRETNPGLFDKTKASVTAFLEDLAKQPGITDDLKLFLANGYYGLEAYAKAAEMLKQVPAPTAPPSANKKPEDVTEAEKPAYDDYQKKLRVHRGAQFTLAKCLRKEKKYDECKKLLDGMLGTKEKPGWAWNNREVRHESIFLLEDQGKFASKPATDKTPAEPGAYELWSGMMKAYQKGLVAKPADTEPTMPAFGKPKPADNAPEQVKAAWAKEKADFEAARSENWRKQRKDYADQGPRRQAAAEYYFYVMRCVYLSQEKVKDAAKRGEALDKWVDSILKFETNTKEDINDTCRRMFNDLLDDNKELMDRYKKKGGKVFLEG